MQNLERKIKLEHLKLLREIGCPCLDLQIITVPGVGVKCLTCNRLVVRTKTCPVCSHPLDGGPLCQINICRTCLCHLNLLKGETYEKLRKKFIGKLLKVRPGMVVRLQEQIDRVKELETNIKLLLDKDLELKK